MTDFIQYAFTGCTIGAIYALVAIGFSVIYNATRIVNFAQGEFVMIGAMTAVSATTAGLPLWLAGLLGFAATAGAGIALEFTAVRLARGATVLMLIVLTIGASVAFRGLAQVVWDRNFHSLPAFSEMASFEILGASITPQGVWILAATLAVVIALHLFFTRSTNGKAMLAVAIDRDAAMLSGISVNRVTMIAFALAGGLGALGGILIAPVSLIHFESGVMLGLKGFAAAILGGLGSFPGAILGGVLLGIGETFAAGYVSSAYKDALAFLVLLLVILWMPRGLLGARVVERV